MYTIGIDVSKGKSTIAILQNGSLISKVFSVDHTEDGVNKILSLIEDIPISDIKFVMEATGIYHFPLLFKLLDLGFFVSVENPFLLKKFFDANIRKVKNDRVDAIKIAQYGYFKWFELKSFCKQDETYNELQFLSRQYSQFLDLKVKAKIQFNNLLNQVFPNFELAFNDNSNQFLFMLDVFEKFFHPSLVTKFTEEEFLLEIAKINSDKKRGLRSTITKIASSLYQIANSTLPARPANESTKLICISLIDNLRGLENATKSILAQMDGIASTLPEFQVVSSMSGVGVKTRAKLIAEIGDIRRFDSANSLIAYAGIDTPQYQSGNFSATQVHITKRGNKHLRKCGYEIMRMLKISRPQKDSAVYNYILKKESEGKNKAVCKIAGFNKFLRIYYARVKEIY